MEDKNLPERKPFAFSAVTSKNLIRGELLTFYVDASGKLTCDKLELIKADRVRVSEARPDA